MENGAAFRGRNEEDEDAKRLRQRAQDNVEFRNVTISAPPEVSGRRRGGDGGGDDGALEMSISYRGRKGLMPDIESLVVFIPHVKFPRDRCRYFFISVMISTLAILDHF